MHTIATRANLEQHGTIRGASQYRSASSANGHSGLRLIYLLPKFTPTTQYSKNLSERQREALRRCHAGGDAQIEALLASAEALADSSHDMSFTSPHPSTILARTLIVQGDRDPLYPVEMSLEMAKAIPRSGLWIVPNSCHGTVIGER